MLMPRSGDHCTMPSILPSVAKRSSIKALESVRRALLLLIFLQSFKSRLFVPSLIEVLEQGTKKTHIWNWSLRFIWIDIWRARMVILVLGEMIIGNGKLNWIMRKRKRPSTKITIRVLAAYDRR